MKKVTECIKNHIWVIYLILFVFMVVRHASVKLGVADDIWFLEQSKMGLINYTQMRIQTWTSRNIIELVMLVLLNINKWVWIILDSGMFVLVLHSLRRIICPTKENDGIITFFLMLVIMLYPFGTFGVAGWYATTLNYVWPLALGLYGLSYIIQIISNEKISIAQQISYVVASLYAINQEQMCALFVGFYALFMIYSLVKHKKVSILAYIILVLSFIMLGYHALCPGNELRKVAEMSAYYPAFYGFKLMDKLLLGVLSTIAIGSLQPAYIIFVWNIMLIYIIYKNTKNKGQYLLVGLMTFVTFVVSVSDRYCNHRGFYQIFNVFNDYTKVIEHISLNMNVCLIILYFICILLISFYVIKTNLGNKTMFISLIIICAAFCSRVVLGFSPSIFVSGTRTFVNSYFLIVIATFLCVNSRKLESVL